MELRIRKSKVYAFFEYLLGIALILNCRSMWTSLTETMNWFNNFAFLLTIFSAVVCILLFPQQKRKTWSKVFFISLAFCIYIILYALFNTYNATGLMRLAIITIVLLTYQNVCEGKSIELLFKYEQIILILVASSLIIWIFGCQLNLLKPTGIVHTVWTTTGSEEAINTYFNIYFDNQTVSTWTPIPFNRNISIFTEAPMCALHFLIALMIEVILKPNPSKWKTLLIILGIVSTFSTTGYVLCMVIIFSKILFIGEKKSLFQVIKIVAIPVGLIVGYFVAYNLISSKLGTGSGSIRLDDFSIGYKVWKENIVFGCGFSNDDYLRLYMEKWRSSNTGFSNSLTQILAQGGIWLSALYLVPFGISIKKTLKNNDKLMVVFIICFLCLFTFTVITYQYLTVFMLIALAKTNNWRQDCEC